MALNTTEQERKKANQKAREADLHKTAKLKKEVAALRSENTDLKSENTELRSRVGRLESAQAETQALLRQFLATSGLTASVNTAPSQILFSDPGSREASTPASRTGPVSKSEMQREDSTPSP